MISASSVENKYTSTGKHSGYKVTLFHSGLDEYRHLTASNRHALGVKIHNAESIMEKKWQSKLKTMQREADKVEKAEKAEKAQILTQRAQRLQSELQNILQHTLSIDDTINWEEMYDRTKFDGSDLKRNNFIKYRKPDKYPSSLIAISKQKVPSRDKFFTKINFFKIILGQKKKILEKQSAQYHKKRDSVEKYNSSQDANQLRNQKTLEAERVEWKNAEKAFLNDQTDFNSNIDRAKSRYFDSVPEAVEEYCNQVLDNSEYSDQFPKDYDLQYNPKSKMIVIDYQLPSMDDLPTLLDVKYVASRDNFTEKHLSATALNKLFDSVIYQICLRTIHEIFEADASKCVDLMTFNGIVTSLNAATGKMETNCILSLQTNKEEFESIGLSQVDPKACFKGLKGVSASKLSSLAPVKPISNIDRHDKRFTTHYDVADSLDNTTNLAAMDWEDFEHLIREVFSKQFSENGGEVKVTKASRDGGVDAIAFDPDPIRGGKIIIQAKRYTYTVSVSAVRDLFGTVTSEGANKGILVTTADYGPDAYAFALGKPLTLLNGSNLLHLLHEHGHEARIDIKEAKLLQKQL